MPRGAPARPPVRLARPQRDGAALADEERIERIDEVGVVAVGVARFGVEDLDLRSELLERRDEPVVLPPCSPEIDRPKEAVGGILERPTESGPGSGYEDLAEVGRHALGAETRSVRVMWRRIRGPTGAPPLVAPRSLGGEMSGFAASGRVERVSPRLARAGADGNVATIQADEDVIEFVDVRTADPLIDRWAASANAGRS